MQVQRGLIGGRQGLGNALERLLGLLPERCGILPLTRCKARTGERGLEVQLLASSIMGSYDGASRGSYRFEPASGLPSSKVYL